MRGRGASLLAGALLALWAGAVIDGCNSASPSDSADAANEAASSGDDAGPDCDPYAYLQACVSYIDAPGADAICYACGNACYTGCTCKTAEGAGPGVCGASGCCEFH